MTKKSQAKSRTKPPEERRADLLQAAAQLFLKHGVAATNVEQITTAAGVAKGTFYLYFDSKDAALIALGERFSQDLLEGILTAVDKKAENDWHGKLEAWITSAALGYLASIQLHDIVFHGPHKPTRRGMVDNPVINHLAALLETGASAKAWAISDARLTAVFLFNGLHSAVDDAYLREKQVNRSRLIKRIRNLCFRAVELAVD